MISGSFYACSNAAAGWGAVNARRSCWRWHARSTRQERPLGEFIEGSTVPASGDQRFLTSGRLPGVSAGTHTITLETGDVQPKGAGGKLTPLMVGAEDAAIDATLTG